MTLDTHGTGFQVGRVPTAPVPNPAAFPRKLEFLFQPKRYKVAYGGRGAGRSWGMARALLISGMQQPLRVLCAREFQNSISESVHKVISDQIDRMKLPYVVEKAKIYNPQNGTEFYFEGIRNNTTRIKSYEGLDRAWVEEANKVSKSSWEILIPTIRKENSEIWVSFNPELETDETYQRFVKNTSGVPPEDLACVKMTWEDNPFFPEVLRKEMLSLKASDLDAWLNIWEGECRVVLDGAVYSKELRDASLDGRFCKVPWERTTSVDTFWDLGYADTTAIWFGQYVGFEYRLVDYYQNSMYGLDHYLQVLQNRGYTYGTLWLPHDAKAKTLGTGKSVEELCRAAGHRVRIVPKLSLADGITAARMIFSNCYFDEVKCTDGIQALRHYRYEVMENKEGQLSKAPIHDQYSHAADAFRYFAVAVKEPRKEGITSIARRGRDLAASFITNGTPQGWMR